jgi:hypothetical protein
MSCSTRGGRDTGLGMANSGEANSRILCKLIQAKLMNIKSEPNLTSYLTWSMGLYHPLDGITNLKYKLLYFLTPIKNSKRKALAFNRDRCCHLAICLWLILFHCLPLPLLPLLSHQYQLNSTTCIQVRCNWLKKLNNLLIVPCGEVKYCKQSVFRCFKTFLFASENLGLISWSVRHLPSLVA